ncbi:MAG TPA: glycosyltransferase [Ktedonobacterales bacterium]|jgi:GT2 family glycosyltransferase
MDDTPDNGGADLRTDEYSRSTDEGQSQPLVSVITPTYNRRESLLATLRALESQSFPAHQFEVVVIADGCTDGSADACRALRTSYALRVIEQANAGPAVARNAGCQQAHAPLLVFLDDDVIPDPDFLTAHWRIHQQASKQVVIGPLLRPPNARLQPWVYWELATLEQQYGAMARGEWEPSPRQFYTGNASVARVAVLDAGGFNPEFRRAEDVEMAYRLEGSGHTFVFAPQARGLHYAQRSFTSWKSIASAYGRADVMMARILGFRGIVNAVGKEFHQRVMPLQLVARACISRPPLLRATVTVNKMAARLLSLLPGRTGRRLSGAAYSVIFNLLYWEGVAKEIGYDAFWDMVRHNDPRRVTTAPATPVGAEREKVTQDRK